MKPSFDALGGGYFDAAQAIAARSRATWHQGREYEEDFLYAHFLLQLTLSSPEEALTGICDRFEHAQAGAKPTRVEVCRAFLRRETPAFNAALAQLLEERRENVEAMVERGALSEEISSWLRYFSSEGLALVRLAEQAGIGMSERYMDIPEQVRPLSAYAFDPNAWCALDYYPPAQCHSLRP